MAALEGQAPGSFLARARPLVLARFFSAFLAFCIPLVLARMLSLEEFGTYKQLFLVSQTLYYVLPFGMTQSLFFFVPRAEGRLRPLYAQTLAFLLLASVAAAGLVLLASPALAGYLSNADLLAFTAPLALFTAGLIFSSPLEIALTSQGRTRAAAALYLVSDTARTAAMVVPVLLGFGLSAVMGSLAAFAGLRVLATLWQMLGRGRGPLWGGGALGRQLAYAAPFGAAMALAIPQQYGHQWAVGGLVPPEQFAIYAVACFQLPLIGMLYAPVSEVLMVRLGELERTCGRREGTAAFREATGKLAYAFLPLGVFLFAAAPEFISALFGPRFLAAVPLFRIGILAIGLAIFPVDGALRATGHTGHLFRSYLLKALLTVPLLWGGVTLFGMRGAMGAAVVTEALGAATLMAALPRALGLASWRLCWAALLPLSDLARAGAGALGAGASVVALRWVADGAFAGLPADGPLRFLPLAVVGGGFAVTYLGLVRASGVSLLSWLRPGAAAAGRTG